MAAGSRIRRWGAEECYRFEKQGFGIEKATVRRYRSIRTLMMTSVKRMFLFRWKRRKRKILLNPMLPLLPFFPKPISSLFELEYTL